MHCTILFEILVFLISYQKEKENSLHFRGREGKENSLHFRGNAVSKNCIKKKECIRKKGREGEGREEKGRGGEGKV